MSTSIDFSSFKPKDPASKERKASLEKEKQIGAAGGASLRWWLSDGQTLAKSVMTHVASIIRADKGRIESYNTYAKLYGTYTPVFWNGYQLASSGKPTAPLRERLTYNIVQSCIDTLTARIAQNKPKPMFLTEAGDSKKQRKAKKLDSFCYGLYYESNFYQMAPKIFRDSLIFGEGIMHVFSENGRIRFERVMPYEILVDYLESHYGPESTKSLFRIKNIDRTELKEAFPDKGLEIDQMGNTAFFLNAAQRSVSDTVTVAEAWRLPVGNQSGRHVIVTENAVLLDEEYEDHFFPFAIMRYSSRLYGFYAQGMAEQLVPTQIEINRTLISIQRSLYLGGTHKIFVKAGSKVIKSHFDNMIGTIMEYAGDTMPQYVVPQLVQPEIYNHLNNMKQGGYELSGVSQLAAANQKPLGLDSGKALRAYEDNQIQRFQTVAQSYEQFAVDIARICVSVGRKAYEESGNLSVKVPGKRFIQTIDWKDVDMTDDEFTLQIYPVSKLPNDPEGRLQTIQEMMAAGLLTPEAGKRLLDFPDLEAEENLYNASTDYLHKILDAIVEDGDFTPPAPDDNLVKAKQLVMEYIAQGKLNNLDEDKMDLLRTFKIQIDTLNDQAQAAMMAQQQQAGMGTPMAAPTAQPTSPMLQNTANPVVQ